MYIYDRQLPVLGSPRNEQAVILRPSQRYYYPNHMQGLEGSSPQRRIVKADDVPVKEASPTSKRIAKAIRTAVANMSRSHDVTEQNTAQRIFDSDVTIRFVTREANPETLLKAQGMSEADIKSKLKTSVLWNMPGHGLELIPKRNIPRASEDNGIIYVPTDSSEPYLTTDLIHEVNHAMNPGLIKERDNPREYLWEKFNQEARAKYIADLRTVKLSLVSDKQNIPLRVEQAIELARQQAKIRGWTSKPEWDAAFEARVSSWRPNGNLDNHK
jgi:hypothetical protein